MEIKAVNGTVEVREDGLFVKTERPFKFEQPFNGLIPYRTVKPFRMHRIFARSYYEDFKEKLEETFPGNPAAQFYSNVEKKVIYMRVLEGNKDAGIAFNNLGVFAFMKAIRPFVKKGKVVDSDGVEWIFKKKEGEVTLHIKDIAGTIYKSTICGEKRAAIEIAAEAFLREEVKSRETFYMSDGFGVTVMKNKMKLVCPGGSISIFKEQAAEILGVVDCDVKDNVFIGLGGKIVFDGETVKIITKNGIYKFKVDCVTLFETISAIRRGLFRNRQLLKVALFSSLTEEVVEEIISGKNPDIENPLIAGYFSLKRKKIEQNGLLLNIHIFGRGAAFDVEKENEIIASVKFRRGNLYAIEKYLSEQDKEVILKCEHGRNVIFKKSKNMSFVRIDDRLIELSDEVKYFLRMSLEQFLKKGDLRPFKKDINGFEIRAFNIFDRETGYPIAGVGFKVGKDDVFFHVGIKKALKVLATL